ncbi:hypothetical protein K7W42_12115 [Deinococcus sp. HMF7604]|uniref:hypothetical protein n=1 Tax=Deinococcus betulae TaxID=2873312 RepID=UPI001CCDF257|nr:hypothetical protein [Deinococcus betulae]MBZ9751611.1 hypothetical protein [Deinococcus betulae]
MSEAVRAQLDAINWRLYETAYGSAEAVPDQLFDLLTGSSEVQLAAAHQLWCALCHQHAYLSSAAAAALPFLLRAIQGPEAAVREAVLNILSGFAYHSVPPRTGEQPSWVTEIRRVLLQCQSEFEIIAQQETGESQEWASQILEDLNTTSRYRSLF